MSSDKEHLVQLRNMRIATRQRTLVADVNVDVYGGRVTAMMGPSGSGKTLTACAIMGFIEVNPGLMDGSLRFPAFSDRDTTANRQPVYYNHSSIVAVTRHLVRLPEATHWLIHEQPARVTREIAQFVGDAG